MCVQVKPISEFSWANKARGYRDSKCKSCRAKTHRRWYLANRDYKLMRNMQGYRERLSRRGNQDSV